VAKLFEDAGWTTGHTPLVRIHRLIKSKANVYAKLEYFNPLSSVKDRIGLAMIAAGANRICASAGINILHEAMARGA